MEQYTKQTKSFEETISLSSMISKTVVTPRGSIIGKVLQVRIQDGTCHLEGLVIRKGFLHKPFFVSKDYIQHISLDAIMLSEELTHQYVKTPVLYYSGDILGKVLQIKRVQQTNKIESILVKKKGLFGKKVVVAVKDVKQFGKSLLLKEDAKKY